MKDMELYFLDGNFSVILGPFDEYTSAVWSEKYFEAGEFTIHIPRAKLPLIRDAVYVRTQFDSKRGCMCGRISYIESRDATDCEIGGGLLETLLSDRLMCGEGGISGYGNMYGAVLECVAEKLHSSPVAISDFLPTPLQQDSSYSLSWSWNSVSEWLYSVLKPYGASFRVLLDMDTMRPVLRLVCGKNRSEDSVHFPHENRDQRAVFSLSYGNIFSVEFESDSGKTKNCAYIEGTDGTVVTVDRSGGGERREIYRKAGDISPEKYGDSDAYTSALISRGEELLAKYPRSLFISAESDADALPHYGNDYELGDICDIADDELGLSFGMRLTTVDTVAENGVIHVHPGFGEVLSLKDRIRELTRGD